MSQVQGPRVMAETPTLARSKGDAGGFTLWTPYDERFVDEIKAVFPRGTRNWDPGSRTWWVAEHYREELVQLCLRYWPSLLIVGAPGEDDFYMSRDGSSVQQGRLL